MQIPYDGTIKQLTDTLKNGLPLSGNAIVNVVKDTEISIPIERRVAKITLRVKLGNGEGLPTTGWKFTPSSLAPLYWFPTAEGNFPADADTFTPIDLASTTDITLNESTFTTFEFYLPINRRGEVAETSAIKRKENAPAKSTYILLSSPSPIDIQNGVTNIHYYIHLGSNFTSDFNLSGNVHYTYNVVLYKDESNIDSRVDYEMMDISHLQYTGFFAGNLEKNSAGEWQFSKTLWVENIATASDPTKAWGPNPSTTNQTNSFTGKSNTLALKDDIYPAANYCFIKNTNYSNITTIEDPNYIFYPPAQAQLMGIWAVHNSFASTCKLGASSYWSATEYIATNRWNVNFSNGTTGTNGKGNNWAVRCTREL